MIDIAPQPTLRTKLETEAIRLFGDKSESLNSGTIKLFVDYVGRLIVQDGKPQELNPAVIRQEAQSVFLARLQLAGITGEGAVTAVKDFGQAVEQKIQDLDYSSRGINCTGLSDSAKMEINQHLTQGLMALREQAGDSEASVSEGFLIENIANAAIEKAKVRDANGKLVDFDMGLYQETLQSSLLEHIGSLSKATINRVVAEQNEAGFMAAGYVLIRETSGLASLKEVPGADKDLVQELQDGNYSTIDDAAKERVNKALVGIYQKSREEGFDLNLEITKADFSKEEASYLQYMLGQYNKTHEMTGGDLAEMLSKSLPQMFAPGLIGAALGWIFGNTGLGAIAAIVLNTLGGLGSESGSTEVESKGQNTKTPPIYQAAKRSEPQVVASAAA